MPSNILAQGADIPHVIFGTRAGAWKMRARINAPVEGDFSPEVRFQYVMQSPALTPPSKRAIERQGACEITIRAFNGRKLQYLKKGETLIRLRKLIRRIVNE